MKILLAVDGSEGAQKAAAFVRDLASQLQGVAVTILHVVRPLDYRYVTVETGGPAWEKVMQELEASARQKARELLAETERIFPSGVATTILVSVGEAAAEIVNVAKEIGADLIVVGSRGLGRVQGLLMGSVSDRVVHLAHCPVLVVR